MTTPPAAAMLRDPAWLAHRYDSEADAIHFVRVSRAERAAVPFLVDRELGALTAHPVVLRRADAIAAASAPAPLHFLFHSAFCCSTLLARALDAPGAASTLSEPQLLADLVGWRHRGGDPNAIGTVLEQGLALLARPFDDGEAMVIKPSNVANGLASAMLALQPEAKAVLMYAPLPVFLASIARKGIDGRLWARELLSRQLTDGLVADMGFEPRDHLLHTDLQAAAVGWLAQARLFAALAARWPDRVRTLDSEVLVAQPEAALEAVAALFGLCLDADDVASRVFARDAKTGDAFATGQRAADRAAGEALHADEIGKVVVWAEAVAAAAGIALVPPAPLLT